MLSGSHLSFLPVTAEMACSQDFDDIEQNYHRAMSEMRQRNLSSFSADSKMPFALKQRQIEMPMLEYTVTQALSTPRMQQVIVAILLENISKGPGHFSVHRAKEALKQIASKIGTAKLNARLHSSDQTDVAQAIQLLGWLKHSRATAPLLDAHKQYPSQQKLIESVLAAHYPAYLNNLGTPAR